MSRTITVKGTGKVSAKPDFIVISISLEAQDMDYEKTMAMASGQLDLLRSAIAGIGFQRDDLKTTDFNVRTDYENRRQKNGDYKRFFNGYVCSHSLKLEFDFSMERLSQTFSALSKCAADPDFSVQFTVKDKDAVRTALLQNAAENAREEAEILCKAAGVNLGKLLNIDYNWTEVSLCSPTNYAMEMEIGCRADEPSIDIDPDDINASDTVTFAWEIE